MSNFVEYHAEPVEEVKFNIEHLRRSGVVEFNIGGDGQARQLGASVSTADLAPFKEGLLSTLTTKNGSRLTDVTAISDDCRVTYRGMEISVAQAKSLGLVSMESGVPKDTVSQLESSEVKRQEQEQNQRVANTPVDFAGAARETLNQITNINGGNPAETDALFNSILGSLNTEDINGNSIPPEKALEKAANTFLRNVRDPELTPELAGKMVSGIMDAYSQASAKYISKNHGVSGDQVLGWAAEALKPNEKTRVYRSVYHGDKRVLDALVSRYQHAKAKENNYV